MRSTLACLVACMALAGAAPSWAQVPPAGVTVFGRVLDPAPAPPDGVACCDVALELQIAGVSHSGWAKTRSDGTFGGVVSCTEAALPVTLIVSAQCCGASHVETLDTCFEPGGQLRVVDVGDLACANAPRQGVTMLQGTVLCRAGALLDPVADCSIFIPEESGFAGDVFTRSDANGDWEGCLSCLGRVTHVQFQCCGEVREVDLSGCPERISVPVVCDPCPVPPCGGAFDAEISGRVTCDADGDGVADPVPGCDVLVSFPSNCAVDDPPMTVTTDQDGVYRTCAPCEADPADCWGWQIRAEAACCGGVVTWGQAGCPLAITMPDLACVPAPGGACAPAAPCAALETIVSGVVTCDGPAGPQPSAGCLVSLTPVGCGAAPVSVTTDAAGAYSACLGCVGCSQVSVLAECCGQAVMRNLACGVATQADISCGACAPPPPCTPQETLVSGVVTCDGPAGPEPSAGCVVSLTPIGCGAAPVSVTTDAAGAYSACVSCAACSQVSVRAECCGQAVMRNLACGIPTRADISCGACVVPRPCPAPAAMLVDGVVLCAQAGNPSPLARCPVSLRILDAGGLPLGLPTDATTDGGGRFAACVPCALGLASVEATASCCSAREIVDATGCPEALSVPTLACSDCAPCPAGTTRVQGRVRCRGGGVVPDCGVRLSLQPCGEPELLLDVATDRLGNFRACVPCPCAGTTIRATSTCCAATRAILVDRCGPITPIPTLTCPSPCN
jgi:hypothetical protein